MSILQKVFGTKSSKEIYKISKLVDKIESLERTYANMTNKELRDMTDSFKEQISNGKTMDDILPYAFAVVREASRRVLNQFPFRVQLIGAIILNQGRVAEMKTGEGKTLTAAMPAYLNALFGTQVHIVTVNDYLAERDATNIGSIYRFLGLTVGALKNSAKTLERKAIYNCDIVYGTVAEFGFDYLRDNMQEVPAFIVQKGLEYAIIDEADNILIDEARTPLIISGKSRDDEHNYNMADTLVKTMKGLKLKEVDTREITDDIEEDYVIDEKHHSIFITEAGYNRIERYYGIKDANDSEYANIINYVTLAIRANAQLEKDKDYIIENGEIIIIDEVTGRLMYGRQYNAGLHQAVEAKEHLEIHKETVTLSSITIQNFFRMYNKLSGMTGTAKTEEAEFIAIYSLDVVEIPTNQPMIRNDKSDLLYTTLDAKYKAIINTIKAAHEKGQPVLVGTTSVEKSEKISDMLKELDISHNVLNAKNHRQEAYIIAQAGKPGAITISTNMAGRGTDIILGGNIDYAIEESIKNYDYSELIDLKYNGKTDEFNLDLAEFKQMSLYDIQHSSNRIAMLVSSDLPKIRNRISSDFEGYRDEVIKAGGLLVIGTERNEARRIDDQLRGRSGRQGDPGESVFIISTEDDLIRVFGGEKIAVLAEGLKTSDDAPIKSKMLDNLILSAQKSLESIHFKARKTLLEFDNVLDEQRRVTFKHRKFILNRKTLIDNMRELVDKYIEENLSDADVMEAIDKNKVLESIFENDYFVEKSDIVNDFKLAAQKIIDDKAKGIDPDVFNEFIKKLLLNNIDESWSYHMDNMDELRDGIGLRAYGGKDPVQEYRVEGTELFNDMIKSVKQVSVEQFMLIKFTFEKVDVPFENIE